METVYHVNASTKRQPSTSHDFPTKVGNQKNDQKYLQTSSIHSQSKTWFNKNKKIGSWKQANHVNVLTKFDIGFWEGPQVFTCGQKVDSMMK